MSRSLRAVTETWGPSADCGGLQSPEEAITEFCDNLNIMSTTNDYGEFKVVWIESGNAFLTEIHNISAETISSLAQELGVTREGLSEFLDDLKATSERWKASLDPDDGSLRFYVDQY